MQIWVLDKNPYISASLLTDKECRKMLVEQLQLMSTYLRSIGYRYDYMYLPIPQGKELVKFIGKNMSWNLHYLRALVNENIRRNPTKFKDYLSINTAVCMLKDFFIEEVDFNLTYISFRCKKEYPLYLKLNKKELIVDDGIFEYKIYYEWNKNYINDKKEQRIYG